MSSRSTDDINPVHVAVTCDENYAMPLAAMLASLAANLDPDRRLVIHALGHDLKAPVWDRLTRSLPEGRAQWHRIDVDTTGLCREGFGTRAYDHISPVCYLRLLLPELLPGDVELVHETAVAADFVRGDQDDVTERYDQALADIESRLGSAAG